LSQSGLTLDDNWCCTSQFSGLTYDNGSGKLYAVDAVNSRLMVFPASAGGTPRDRRRFLWQRQYRHTSKQPDLDHRQAGRRTEFCRQQPVCECARCGLA
jgi:hypothetical protein